MVIEKVHGLQATDLSLNDRFTMLAAAPEPWLRTPRRRLSSGSYNPKNKHLIEQIARRLEQQAKRQSLRQRLGVSPWALRRFGSESSLPGLRRSNSFSNLSQRGGVKSRINWRQSNGNLNRSASFGNLSQSAWRGRSLRGFRRRGGGNRALRGRFRGGLNYGRIGWVQRGAGRGRAPAGGAGRAGRGGRGRPVARGKGRGGILRNQTPKPVPTKEELDLQLDQYMASTKVALDAELDTYMKNAMDLE